ncbi:MAG: exo-alpha-sialidase [Candidatus Hydrogenedentes bacterium]|nr:exo-alpha-sialidase [Candidatus Hydrogenedentota bacterium]
MTRSNTPAVMLAAALLLAGGGATALGIGGLAPAVTLETLDGFERIMDNHHTRRGTVVFFLSSRCETTASQMARINEIHEANRFDVLFIGVSANPEESGDELRRFATNLGAIFPVYRDVKGEALKAFGAATTPEFFLLDHRGRLIYKGGLGGAAYEPGLERAITQYLNRVPVETARTPAKGTSVKARNPRRDVENLYGLPQFRSQFIFQEVPGAAVHHCSTVAEAPNGDILALWYGGSYESAEDQALYLARLVKGAAAWSAPERFLVNHGQPPGNAVIFQGPDGRMHIIWGRMEGSWPKRRGSGWGDCRLLTRTSGDNGHTWSADVEIGDSLGWLPRNTPVTLADGTFALPISGNVRGEGGGSFLLVLDETTGEWSRRGFIRGGSQPTVVVRDNGDLLCLMRGSPRTVKSVSKDHGHTWTPATPTDRRNPDSGLDTVKLKSGRVLQVYTDTESGSRYPMVIVQSHDDGETWGDLITLATDHGEFSYPSIIQASDGTVHLLYTYRRYSIMHTAFNEDWLEHRRARAN